MNEKIGKVTLNLDYYEGQDFYSDGVIEEHLLELVKCIIFHSKERIF